MFYRWQVVVEGGELAPDTTRRGICIQVRISDQHFDQDITIWFVSDPVVLLPNCHLGFPLFWQRIDYTVIQMICILGYPRWLVNIGLLPWQDGYIVNDSELFYNIPSCCWSPYQNVRDPHDSPWIDPPKDVWTLRQGIQLLIQPVWVIVVPYCWWSPDSRLIDLPTFRGSIV